MTFDPNFKVTTFFEVEYRKLRLLRFVLKTKLLLHNGKLYQTYGMVLCLVTLTEQASKQAYLFVNKNDFKMTSKMTQTQKWLTYKRVACQAACATERTSAQAETQQPIGVVGPLIIHVNGLATWLGFVDMLPAALLWTSPLLDYFACYLVR